MKRITTVCDLCSFEKEYVSQKAFDIRGWIEFTPMDTNKPKHICPNCVNAIYVERRDFLDEEPDDKD